MNELVFAPWANTFFGVFMADKNHFSSRVSRKLLYPMWALAIIIPPYVR